VWLCTRAIFDPRTEFKFQNHAQFQQLANFLIIGILYKSPHDTLYAANRYGIHETTMSWVGSSVTKLGMNRGGTMCFLSLQLDMKHERLQVTVSCASGRNTRDFG
jgi:hypothetical protein